MSPEQSNKQNGADLNFRLWVASVDSQQYVRVSDEILNSFRKYTRKIRNTMSFLLANTDLDFNS